MSDLILRKLSTLPVGASVTLTCVVDGDSHRETLSGTVTDNNFKDGLEIQTADGTAVLLEYEEIRRLSILSPGGAANPPQLSTPPAPPVPVQRETGQSAYVPYYQRELSGNPSVTGDRELKALLNQLPKAERKKLNGAYDSFLYGVKCGDPDKMETAAQLAARTLMDQVAQGKPWNRAAYRFCGALLQRADILRPDIFAMGQWYADAALCAWKQNQFTEAGAYALASLIRSPEENTDLVLTVLEKSVVAAGDVSGLALLQVQLPPEGQRLIAPLLGDLLHAQGEAAAPGQSSGEILSRLSNRYTHTGMGAAATKLLSGSSEAPPREAPSPVSVSAEPERRYGWVSQYSADSRTGTIAVGETALPFQYQSVTGPVLRRKLEEADNGNIHWVEFTDQSGQAVGIVSAPSPLVRARKAAREGDYQTAVAICREALGTPMETEALGEMARFALEWGKSADGTDLLRETAELCKAHEDHYPRDAWSLATLGQLCYATYDLSSAVTYMRQALESPNVNIRSRVTFLAHTVHYCETYYNVDPNPALMTSALDMASEWLRLYQENGLQNDVNCRRYHPRVLRWKCRAECELDMAEEAEQDYRTLLREYPREPRLRDLRIYVLECRRRWDAKHPAAANESGGEGTEEPAGPGPADAPAQPDGTDTGQDAPVSGQTPVPDDDADDEESAAQEELLFPEDEEEAPPYVDYDGWEALGMTRRDAAELAVNMDGPDAAPLALSCLHAAARMESSLRPLCHMVSLAAGDPMAAPDYSVASLLSALEESDPDYPRLSGLCMGAAFLRASFLWGRENDYSARALRDSIQAARDIPALGEACDTMEAFRAAAGQAVDIYADYRNHGVKQLQEELDEAVRAAEELYTKYILTVPRESVSFRRLLETKKILFAQDGELARLLRAVADRNQEALEAEKAGFVEKYLGGVPRFAAGQVSAAKIDELIAEAWEESLKSLSIRRDNSTLQGNRRNNLRSNLSEILRAVCRWYDLAEQSAGLTWRTEAGESAYQRLKPQLQEQLSAVAAACGDEDGLSAEERLGRRLLAGTASELSARLDGSWRYGQEKFFYACFLMGDHILLDENFLPDLDATFCSLPDFHVFARIRAQAAEAPVSYQDRLNQIYGPDKTHSNYGTASRIREYLDFMGRGDEASAPENAEQFESQSRLQTQMRYRAFLESYALARNCGQIMQSDAFCYHLEETARHWYAAAMDSGNYGFFASFLDQAEGRIHTSAQAYAVQLDEQLDALIAGNREEFDSHPGYADAIRNQIDQQNFIVAEDWMHRVRLGDFSLEVTQPEALGYLDRFWSSYADIYRRVGDSSRSLGTILLGRKARNKDARGAQKLIESWLSNGSPSNPERMTQLLNQLGWQNIRVEPYPFAPDARAEVYRVTREGAEGEIVPLHPIAAFGSRVSRDGMYVSCLYGGYDCDRLFEAIRALDVLNGSKVILLDYALGGADRRALARMLKARENGLQNVYLVIDRVLLCYLADNYNERLINRILMAAGIPFSYCQPYVVESTHTMPPEIFIGRRDELRNIERHDGVNLLYGGRQLGKSALFKMARAEVDGRKDKDKVDRAVLVDINDCGCAAAARKLSAELLELGILPEGEITEDWDELCAAIRRRLRGGDDIRYLLVMLDEADDFIADCGERNYQPLAALKDVQQTLPGRFKFVLAGLHNVVRFNREVALGRNSVVTHLPSLKITPFRTPEAQELLTRPLSYLGLSLPDKVTVSQILATVNYFPGLIQLYCQKLVDSLRAADYAGYDVNATPPYVVTGDHIRRVMADREFVEQIREKFEITLRLDQDQGGNYYPLALLIGWMYTAEPHRDGYTAADVARHARDLGVAPLNAMEEEKIEALMMELQDLNILRGVKENTWLLASKNFRDLLGTDEEIFERLSRAGEAVS